MVAKKIEEKGNGREGKKRGQDRRNKGI